MGETVPDEHLPALEPGTIPTQATGRARRHRVAEALRRAVAPVEAIEELED